MNAELVVADQTGDEFLTELFEYELCTECGKDADRHEAMAIGLGAYGTNWFAFCLDGESS